MKRGIIAMAVSFVACIVFIVLDAKDPAAKTYNAEIGIAALFFLVALVYTTCKIIAFLKRKTVEQVKKTVSATAYGKKKDLRDIIRSRIFSTDGVSLQIEIQKFAHEKGLDKVALEQAIREAVPLVIEDALDDGILTDKEEQSIESFLKAYELTSTDIDLNASQMLVRGMLIRDLLEGNVKPRIRVPALPFKPIKNETLIWVYQNMTVAEIRKESKWKGGSQGASIKIAQGLYWRIDKMTAERVATEAIRDLGVGTVVITSHHLFYKVGNDAERIRHDNIFSLSRYADAVVVHRDGETKNPLVLKTDDTWFLANILQNAQNWS